MSRWRGPLPAGAPARVTLFLLVSLLAVAVAWQLDGTTYRHLRLAGGETDLTRLLRVGGALYLWLAAAAALLLADRPERWPRGLLVAGGALAGGALAELLKLLIRRERPGLADGQHLFRPWSEAPWSTVGLGLPSGHTLVAFTAFGLLARLFPRAAPVWYALAVGCALERLLEGAHFLSDVVLAASLGTALAWLLGRWTGARRGRRAAGCQP